MIVLDICGVAETIFPRPVYMNYVTWLTLLAHFSYFDILRWKFGTMGPRYSIHYRVCTRRGISFVGGHRQRHWHIYSGIENLQTSPGAPLSYSPKIHFSFHLDYIDSQDMLEYWLKVTTPSARISLAKVMNKAAGKLKCKYANGRSVVTYGIPIYRRK